MVNIHRKMKSAKMKSALILQVHDELVFDAHKNELQELQHLVKQEMENALPLNVPVVVEMGTGNNWLEAH
jgi:DNA polymerase-1